MPTHNVDFSNLRDQAPQIDFAKQTQLDERIYAIPSAVPVTDEDWNSAAAHFRRHGFIYIEDFWSPAQVEQIKNWAALIAETSSQVLRNAATSGVSLERYLKDHPESPIVVPEKKHVHQVCRAEDFVSPDTFAEFRVIPLMVGSVLAKLQGEEYVLFKEKINFKWPGGGAFPPHQDFPAYDFLQPGEHATSMLTVDSATVQNGCLRAAVDWTAPLTGDPKIDQDRLQEGKALLPYYKGGPNNGTICDEYAEKFDWRCLATNPRDLVIFSSFVPHYSDENQSDVPRRAMFLTYNRKAEGDHHSAYYDKKRNDPQNPIFHIATPTVHSAENTAM